MIVRRPCPGPWQDGLYHQWLAGARWSDLAARYGLSIEEVCADCMFARTGFPWLAIDVRVGMEGFL